MKRVVVFANNTVAVECLRIVCDDPESELVGLVLHPESRRRCGDELLAVARLPEDRVLTATQLRKDPDVHERMRSWGADLGLSLFYGYILRAKTLDLFPDGCANLHPSYLPFNRGAYPNVWAIAEGTPAGATLHMLDEGIDTGDILAQLEVETHPWDTGETLYRRLERASVDLFEAQWPEFVRGKLSRTPQNPEAGNHHYIREVSGLDAIDLDAPTTARELLARLRARTFPPYESCFFIEGGRKIFVRVSLEEDLDYSDG